jgi:hypothetical protein
MTDNLPVPDDLPHLNLSQSELDELRKSKKELTEYGKQKLRELMNKDLIFYTKGKETSRMPSPTLETLTLGTKAPEIKLEIKMTEPIEAKVSEEDYQKVLELMNNQEPYPDEMFEEAERRESERKALDALDKHLYEENVNTMLKLAEIEKEEWERKERSDTVLRRYNDYYNLECSGLPHGTPITPEQQQMITLQSMIDAIRCEYLNREYNEIAISDIENLIEALYQQSITFLERVRKSNE